MTKYILFIILLLTSAWVIISNIFFQVLENVRHLGKPVETASWKSDRKEDAKFTSGQMRNILMWYPKHFGILNWQILK